MIARLCTWIASHELWALALAAPFLLFPNRWAALPFGLIVLVWLCRRVAWGRFTLRTAMDVPIAILVLMTLIAYDISADRDMSWAKLWGIMLQVAIFYAMVNGLRSERDVLRVTALLVVGTCAVAAISLLGGDWNSPRLLQLPVYHYLPRLIRGLPGSGVPVGTDLFNPREVGATMAMLLPVSAAFSFFGRNRVLRILSVISLVVGGGVLVLTQSPQAMLGFGLAVLLIATWRSRWALLCVPVGALFVLGVIVAYGPERLVIASLSADHFIGTGVVLRWDIWNRALAMVRDMPYTGIGLNTFPLIQTQFYTGLLLGSEPHAHNVFLHTAVDLGLPGLMAFIWILFAFYLALIKAYRASSDPDLRVVLVGLAAGVLAYLGNGLIDTITLGAKPVAALWAMFGLPVAMQYIVVGRKDTVLNTNSSIGNWVGIGLLATVLLLVSVLRPATLYLNVGALEAHRTIWAARSGNVPSDEQLQSIIGYVLGAAERDPDNAQAYGLLGSLYAWRGQDAAAVAALERRVALDGKNPLGQYAPFELVRQKVEGAAAQDRWDDLLEVYSYWLTRFPDRAESSIQTAIVWHQYKKDRARATAVLKSGLEQGAQPESVLSYYLAQVEPEQ